MIEAHDSNDTDGHCQVLLYVARAQADTVPPGLTKKQVTSTLDTHRVMETEGAIIHTCHVQLHSTVQSQGHKK